MDRFEPIFETLNSTGTRYVVVGGLAVNLHGYQRFTKDVDVVIELLPEESVRALEALRAIGYEPRLPVRLADFGHASVRDSWARDKGMVVFQMYNDNVRMTVDIFVQYPMDFESLWRDAVEAKLSRTRVRIASLAHLIQMKRSTARPQDLADAEALGEIQRLIADNPQLVDPNGTENP